MAKSQGKHAKVSRRAPDAGVLGRFALPAVMALLLCVALAVLFGVLDASARYAAERDRAVETLAAELHVSSRALEDVTDGGAAPERFESFDAAGIFTVDLLNWEVGNAASVSEVDATYTVAVEGGSLVSVKSGGAEVAAAGDAYTLPKAREKDSSEEAAKVEHAIAVRADDPATPVTVTVTITAPYRKVLSAVVGRGVTAELADYEGVKHLLVHANQYAGGITVDYGGLVPIASVNEGVYGWTPGSAGTATIDARKQETYTFEVVSASSCNVAGNAVTLR